MTHQDWHERWNDGRIGFHEGAVNALLEIHAHSVFPRTGSRIFLPLCGKTRDIAWLLSRGYRVVGAELSELAVRQLFSEMSLPADVQVLGPLKTYRAPGLDIFVGDIFDLTPEVLGKVDGVYDRAALVALPDTIRKKYAAHLVTLTGATPQFLISFDYDQSIMPGPPFSVPATAIQTLYSDHYAITSLEDREVTGGLKGVAEAVEQAWHLTPSR